MSERAIRDKLGSLLEMWAKDARIPDATFDAIVRAWADSLASARRVAMEEVEKVADECVRQNEVAIARTHERIKRIGVHPASRHLAAQALESLAELEAAKHEAGAIAAKLRALPRDEGAAPIDPPWIPWSGGSCPVAMRDLVEIEFRSGEIRTTKFPHTYVWAHHNDGYDIIAYRLV